MRRSFILFAACSIITVTAAFAQMAPLLADRGAVHQAPSYSSVSTTSSPSDAMAKIKETAKACYPVFAECTKNSDCCSGFCRSGRVTAYCDYR
jgi:hypothetical protein